MPATPVPPQGSNTAWLTDEEFSHISNQAAEIVGRARTTGRLSCRRDNAAIRLYQFAVECALTLQVLTGRDHLPLPNRLGFFAIGEELAIKLNISYDTLLRAKKLLYECGLLHMHGWVTGKSGTEDARMGGSLLDVLLTPERSDLRAHINNDDYQLHFRDLNEDRRRGQTSYAWQCLRQQQLLEADELLMRSQHEKNPWQATLLQQQAEELRESVYSPKTQVKIQHLLRFTFNQLHLSSELTPAIPQPEAAPPDELEGRESIYQLSRLPEMNPQERNMAAVALARLFGEGPKFFKYLLSSVYEAHWQTGSTIVRDVQHLLLRTCIDAQELNTFRNPAAVFVSRLKTAEHGEISLWDTLRYYGKSYKHTTTTLCIVDS